MGEWRRGRCAHKQTSVRDDNFIMERYEILPLLFPSYVFAQKQRRAWGEYKLPVKALIYFITRLFIPPSTECRVQVGCCAGTLSGFYLSLSPFSSENGL